MIKQKIKEFFNPGLLIVLGMGAFAVFMGSCLGYNLFLKPYLQVQNSRSWQLVRAAMLFSRDEDYFSFQDKQTKHRLDIGYQYQWQGKSYTGKRYCFWKAPSGAEMHCLIRKFRPGTEINCFVDPDNPGESVISREIPLSTVGIGLGLTGAFVLIGLAIIFFSLRSFLRGTWKCETEDQ